MDLLLLVLILLVLVNYSYAFLMLKDVARHAEEMGRERGKPAIICLISFLQFFLSTFGVSDFAIGAVIYSKLKWVSPKDLPGTLNTACVIPVAIMALIHISSIKVDFALLALPIIAQMTGAYLSPRFVIKLPARAIMVGLTVGICITAAKIIAVKCGFFPAGGDASSLTGGKLAVLTVLSLLYGALNNLGIGSYALTAATVYLLGLEPEAAFPIMMGASAFSVPMGSIQFIKCGRYARKITVFSSLFGGAGVLAAAYLVKRLDISALDWLFAVLLLCGAVSMLTSAGREDAKTFSQPGQEKKTGDFALSRQITAACFFLSMLGTVLLVAVFIKNFNTISYKHAERNIGEYNLRLRNDVVAYLRSHEYILKSAKVGVAHFISQPIVNIDDLRIYMQNTAALDDDISTLYCTSNTVWNRPGGYAVFSRPWDTPADWDNTARPWFIGAKEAHGDISYSSPYSDALTGEVIMDMSMSIHDSEGRDLGVISESITIRSLRAMLKNANWTSDQHISLIDAKGIYVTHPEEDFAESKDFFSDTELEVYRSSILHNDLFLSVGRDITVYSSFIPESKWFLVSIIQTKSIMSAIVRSIFDLFLAPVTVFIFATPVIILILISIIQSESKAKYMAEYATLEKSNFLARMSHEIRTPMNVVIGLSELALREYGKPKILEYITSIRNAGTSLLAIINDILDFSKIESGNVAFNAAPYETAFLLNDTLTLIRFRLAGKSPELITDIAADIPGGMIGDATRVQQILVNLLTNAVKYTNTGFIRFSAAGERLGEDAIRLTFVIEDSGIGIRPEDMPKLFAYFTRLDEKRNSGIEGAGLGLAIALSLCRAMDGDITVTSEYGKGTVFTATLTQRVADWKPMGNMGDIPPRSMETQRATFVAPDAEVLIVDDFSSNLLVVEGLLAPYRTRISSCLNGREAVALVQERSFDLVLMDHMMPEMDGVEATAAIRALGGRFAELPIIALTANAVSGMREMFLENGFNDFLSKPIDVPKLDEVLKEWIPARKRQRTPADSGKAPEAAAPPSDIVPLFPEMSGLDVAAGIARIGGSQSRYLHLLDTFRRDVEAGSALLEKEPEAVALQPFITLVHALKGALANIGADAQSRLAALLEQAGREGDVPMIRATLPAFREELAALTKRIGEISAQARSGDAGREDGLEAEPLERLRQALEARDIDGTDAVLAELQALPLDDKTRAAVAETADLVLLADFQRAASAVSALLERPKVS